MRLAKKHLFTENYMEALALVATRVERFKTLEGREAELERIYDRLMGLAEKMDDSYDEDFFDNVERIYTAIYCCL